MRLAIAIAAVVTLAGVGPGWAGPLPVYPVDEVCASISGGKPAWITKCVESQQIEHDALAFGDITDSGTAYKWSELPEAAQQKCAYYASHPFGGKMSYPYTALRACARVEYDKFTISHPRPIPHFQP